MLTPLPASTVFVDKSLALIEAAAATAGRMDGRTDGRAMAAARLETFARIRGTYGARRV